jgi:hypothetical protein
MLVQFESMHSLFESLNKIWFVALALCTYQHFAVLVTLNCAVKWSIFLPLFTVGLPNIFFITHWRFSGLNVLEIDNMSLIHCYRNLKKIEQRNVSFGQVKVWIYLPSGQVRIGKWDLVYVYPWLNRPWTVGLKWYATLTIWYVSQYLKNLKRKYKRTIVEYHLF